MKYINFKRYKFSTVLKNINAIRYNFSKFFRFIDFKRYNFSKFFRFIDFKRYDFTKVYKYFDFRRYNFFKIKKINLKNYANIYLYFIAGIIFSIILYLAIPIFYSYDRLYVEKKICKNQKIKCLIKGKINYSFFPSPRIKIKDLTIKDFYNKDINLAIIDNAAIKLSLKNLLIKEKQNFKEIELSNFEAQIDLKEYKKANIKKINFIPVYFKKGKIILLDDNNYVASINDVDLDLKPKNNLIKAILKGNFLNDNLFISIDRKSKDNQPYTNIIAKMSNLNLVTKLNLFDSIKNNGVGSGNISIKKNKNRLNAVFNYKNNEIEILKSNLRNPFLDGKLTGKINFSPYFDYNLDLILNSINFTKLYNSFLALDKENKKKLFNINNKINGKLNFSSEKIYSKYNLVKSFESRLKFYNGNLSIEQFLMSLGKLGAADINGKIIKNKKFSNFKFESNVFVDDQKKFLSKFGIHNKESLPLNLFISGNFDLDNTKMIFYEMSEDKKLSKEDVDFIELEFNDIMLEDGYTYLFNFPKLKDLIKSVTNEKND